jgi:predicted RNase H-like nuclease
MPLSQRPIGGRRESDNAVSRTYGGRKCSTHTPTAQRPGPISDLLRAQFESEGYQLGTLTLGQRAIIEVYPHPALVELTGAAERLPYKAQKAAKFWPDLTPSERRFRTLEVWREIRSHLNQVITGVQSALPVPDTSAPAWQFKAFEDQLDAVVCAWVGVCALEDRAQPFGDSDSAIWIPTPDARI